MAPLAKWDLPSAVRSIEIFHDGTRIVSGSNDGHVCVWDAQTGSLVLGPLKGHTRRIGSVAISPADTLIASGSDDNTIRIWDARTGNPAGDPLEGHIRAVCSVAFSPDKTRIVSGSHDSSIRIWDTPTGNPLGEPLRGHTNVVSSVVFSPDSACIISGSWDCTIRIWDAQNGAPLGEPLLGHTRSVYSVAFSPNNTRIVSGSWDYTVRVWDADTRAPIGAPLKGHTGSVSSVAFSPDSTRVVSGSFDNTIRIWDASTGAPEGELLKGHTSVVYSVRFSPNGNRIVSGSSDHTICVWETGRPSRVSGLVIYANKMRLTSSPERAAGQSSSAPGGNSVATNTPVPTATLSGPTPDLTVLAPLGSPTEITIRPAPQLVIAAPSLLSTDTPQPASQINHSTWPIVRIREPIKATSSASTAAPSAGRSAKSTTWSGLKTLLDLLNASADVFEPLKSAVGEILECINIYEREAKAREDYEELGAELDLLFWDLFNGLNGSTPSPPTISSLLNLSKGIEKEIRTLKEKGRRNRFARTVEAKEDADEILECYRRIQRLLERFSLHVNINIWKTVKNQATERRLEKLTPSLAAQYGSFESTDLRRSGCIPRTRVDLLQQLKAWAEDSNSKRIYCLNGMAGTGKTTIAYSFCDQLEGSLRLAASFFCSRQLPACRNVKHIIPTVAYQLARFSSAFQHTLSSALEQSPDVHTLKVSTQFQKLIVEPLQTVGHQMLPDLVVVIDALDECDSKDGVDQILETLLAHAPGLPIKFFVTSRPEPQIQDQMRVEQSRGVPIKLDLHNLEHSVVREDIQTYLKAKLVSPKLALNNATLEKLVDQSGVLFIYAATVVRYIEFDNFSRSGKRLKQVLATSSSSQTRSSVEINALYEDILRAALDDNGLDDSERSEIKDILHTVICAQEPMTVGVIAGLLKLDVDSVEAALRPLLSVLHLSSETNGTVTTFHESFPDYILGKHRSGTFYCNSQRYNELLAQRCFDFIGVCNPPFNICDLESSYVFDKYGGNESVGYVPDFDQRVKTAISDEMFYACQHWGSHLMRGEASPALLNTLHEFLSSRLLLWMEIMNLKQHMPAGVGALHRVQSWLQGVSSSNDVRELAVDAGRFALEFSTSPMSGSTPHIYVSALPFWPDQRPVSRYYLPKMQGLTSLAGTAIERRKSEPLAMSTTRSLVSSVGYSHDGTRIFSGSDDCTIRIWDARTGQMVGEPLQGHTSSVNSVAFSHDGTRIVSGSDDRTIRIWDAHSGQMVGEPLEGHTSWVGSVGFSHDGTRIVSGSDDRTIRIWDAHTGQMVGKPLEGHTSWVRSVGSSHDGTRIVSGSDDRTIRIWDAHTGQMVGEPLQGHTSSVNSVAFSHDGTRIVSGSDDHTIRIWDACAGRAADATLDDCPSPIPIPNPMTHPQEPNSHTLTFNPPAASYPTIPPHFNWTLDSKGWVLEGRSKLLIWVPPDVRDCLLYPRNLVVMSTHGSLALGFSDAQLGENWRNCYRLRPALPV